METDRRVDEWGRERGVLLFRFKHQTVQLRRHFVVRTVTTAHIKQALLSATLLSLYFHLLPSKLILVHYLISDTLSFCFLSLSYSVWLRHKLCLRTFNKSYSLCKTRVYVRSLFVYFSILVWRQNTILITCILSHTKPRRRGGTRNEHVPLLSLTPTLLDLHPAVFALVANIGRHISI